MRGDLQQPDRERIEQARANALGDVEVDVRLVRVRIAQDAGAQTIIDEVASLEVTEGDGEVADDRTRYPLVNLHRATQQRYGLTNQQCLPPDWATVRVLDLRDERRREARLSPIGSLENG